jgi:hypothetical protein
MYAAAPSSSRLAAAAAFIIVSLSLQLLLRHFGAAMVHRAAAQELGRRSRSRFTHARAQRRE